MSKLSTTPYRGTKDLFPERERIRQFIFNHWRRSATKHSYEEYSGPLVEPLSLYASKSSEEIVSEQLYHFTDKGGREIGIRPEMTPTLARMVSASRGQYTMPIRWFCIETCMRYERPQRGRMRQFDQLNMDILGGDPAEADFEILATIPSMLFDMGAKVGDFKVKLNHRGFVNRFLQEKTGLDREQLTPLLRTLDAFHKLSEDDFREQLSKLGLSGDQITEVRKMMTQDFDTLQKELPPWDELLELKNLLDRLNASWGLGVFEFDAAIMRGFEYYTALVFEVIDCAPQNNRALFGGGRYDNLVGAFGGESLSGVGYGVSEISIYNFLETHQLLPEERKPVTLVGACVFGDEGRQILDRALMVARQKDINCERIFGSNKINKVLKSANKLEANAVLMVGPDEAAQGQFKIKNLKTSKEFTISIDSQDLPEQITLAISDS